MHINELRNLVVLARRGVVADSNMKPEEGQAAWAAIGAAEGFIKSVVDAEKAKQEAAVTEDNQEGTESTFTVVNFDADGNTTDEKVEAPAEEEEPAADENA